MFTGNKPRSHSSSAEEDDEKFINVMTFDEVTWDNSMWKMETSKAMAILGTKFLKKDHFVILLIFLLIQRGTWVATDSIMAKTYILPAPYLAGVLGVPEHPRNLGVHKRGEA